jgi:hypothetical protein
MIVGGGPDSIPGGDTFTGNPYVEGVRLFVRAVDALDKLPFGDSAIQRANRRAARAAGYTGDRATLNAIGQGLRTPEFGMQSQDRSQVRPGPPSAIAGPPLVVAPRPTFPAGTVSMPTTTARPPVPYEPPVYQGPPPPPGGWNPSPVDSAPIPTGSINIPGFPVVGVIDVNAILQRIESYNDILGAVFDTATRRPQPAIPKGPTNPRGRPPSTTGDPFPPKGPPPVTVIVNNYPAPARETATERRERRMEGLEDIFVSTRRLPIPAPLPPKAPPTPLWLQLAPLIGSPLLDLIGGAGGGKKRRRDPLTQPTLEQRSLTTNNTTLLTSPFGPPAGAGQVGTNTCECKAPRKKRRKKKRTVCYSGTYIERADGTRKTKRRKVQCI